MNSLSTETLFLWNALLHGCVSFCLPGIDGKGMSVGTLVRPSSEQLECATLGC